MQQKEKLWTKEFIIVASVNFFITLIFFLLMVTIAVYAVDEFDATTSEAGLVTGIFIIGTLIGRLLIGRIIDVIGRMKTLYIGLTAFTLTTLLYYGIDSLGFMIMNRFIHGFALGVASTATGTIMAQVLPAHRKGEGVGYYSMSATLATAIGPFLGIYLSQHAGFQTIFHVSLALGALSLLTSFFLKVPPVQLSRSERAELKGFKLSSFIEPKAIPIALITLCGSFCYSSVLSFITFYGIEVDLVEASSFFFIVYAIAILVSRPFTGRLLDIKGANPVMYPAFVLFAAGMFLLSTANNGFLLLAAAALIGFGFGNLQSSTQAIAIKLTPPHRMGLATSTFFIFLDFGFGFGPYLLGFLIPYSGYRGLYTIMGILVIAVAVLYWYLHGNKESSQRKNKPHSLSV